MVVSLLLSERCEATTGDSLKRTGESGALLYQTSPALQEDESAESAQLRTEPLEPERKTYLTQISQVTRLIMYKLWILLIIDSLADYVLI
jgi:hypothetical protein